MCNKYIILGEELTTCENLRKFLQLNNLNSFCCEGHRNTLDYESCLCQIDHRQVADFLNMPVATDSFNWYFGPDLRKYELENSVSLNNHYYPNSKK